MSHIGFIGSMPNRSCSRIYKIKTVSSCTSIHTLVVSLVSMLLLERGPVQQARCYAGHLHWHIDTLVRIYMYSVAGWLGRGQRSRAQTSQSRDLTSPNHTETPHLSNARSYFRQICVFENQQGPKLNLNLLTSSWIMILSDAECSGEYYFNFLSLSSLSLSFVLG